LNFRLIFEKHFSLKNRQVSIDLSIDLSIDFSIEF